MKRITGRSWAFVIYPESMPENYEEIITDTGLPLAMSPLHDKDVNPTGEPKKPHYHCIVYYENATTLKNVKENVCDKLNATIPIKLESMRGMYRYHIHLDNPEKYQYDDRDRKFFNGFDIDMASKLTRTEINKIIKEIHTFINDNNILEYIDLLDVLKDNDLTNLYDVAIANTLLFKSMLDSKRNKLAHEKAKEKKRKEVD
ncbi:MAG: replication protein [Bacilli bacterium]|nr:replication protein [Bacilli bacterium]